MLSSDSLLLICFILFLIIQIIYIGVVGGEEGRKKERCGGVWSLR